MLNKIKKIVLSLSVVILFALYALQKQAHPSDGAGEISAYLPPTSKDVAVVATDVVVQEVTATPTQTSVPAFIAPTKTATVAVDPTSTASGFAKNQTSSTSAEAVHTPKPKATKTPSPAPVVEATSTPEGQYRDGTYSGVESDAHWGIVKVVAVIENGVITNVQFDEYPNHRSRSKTINRRAMPILVQEAIDSQSADVDLVSGATDTSEAFVESLGFALSKAER